MPAKLLDFRNLKQRLTDFWLSRPEKVILFSHFSDQPFSSISFPPPPFFFSSLFFSYCGLLSIMTCINILSAFTFPFFQLPMTSFYGGKFIYAHLSSRLLLILPNIFCFLFLLLLLFVLVMGGFKKFLESGHLLLGSIFCV